MSVELERKIFQALEKQCEVVCLINNRDRSFQIIRGTEFWKGLLGESGTLYSLYGCLFTQNLSKDTSGSGKYEIFIDESFFQKEKMQGTLAIPNEQGERIVRYHLIQISDEEAGFVILPYDEVGTSQKAELEKIDTIQENYLFSMIVDLRTDSCINSNTTEVGASSQSFMDIKYSDWRNMISNMFLPEDRNMFFTASSPEHILHNLEQNKSFKLELKMLNMAGTYIWVRLSFTRMKGFSKENPRFVYTVQDIDEEMTNLLNQENIIKVVEEQNQQLLRADQAKSAFISNMSHEIRTPINAVLGMNEMIIRETTDEKIRGYANDIKIASRLLLSIINDILDYSKIEVGKMEIIPVEYKPAELLRNVCNLVAGRLKDKEIAFELRMNPKIPRKLYGDEVRVTQVITNILTNAAKYTEKGRVTFSVDVESMEDTVIRLRVSVEDTGIGMREEDLDKLFSAFTRLDEKKNRNIEGTGLGMNIVARLLEQMGSKIEVESTYGVGSKFSFVLSQGIVDVTPMGTFNLEKGNQSTEKKEQRKELSISKARILAVDDSRTNLRVIKALLKRTKAEVVLAQSGKEALELLQQNQFDLVLLDHFMPEMDGVETLGNIRKLGPAYENLPVIVLTANVVPGARDFYLGMGFDDFLEKPINVELLEKQLRHWLTEKCFD